MFGKLLRDSLKVDSVSLGMMGKQNQYNLVLPKGAANRPYYELSEAERIEVGIKIFARAVAQAESVGAQPVIGPRSNRGARVKSRSQK